MKSIPNYVGILAEEVEHINYFWWTADDTETQPAKLYMHVSLPALYE